MHYHIKGNVLMLPQVSNRVVTLNRGKTVRTVKEKQNTSERTSAPVNHCAGKWTIALGNEIQRTTKENKMGQDIRKFGGLCGPARRKHYACNLIRLLLSCSLTTCKQQVPPPNPS